MVPAHISFFANVAVTFVALMILAPNTSQAQCSDEVAWDEPEKIENYGIDSTGHWFVVSAPYEQFINVSIDGVAHGPYNEVEPPIFHRHGNAWAFATRTNLIYSIVTNSGVIQLQTMFNRMLFPTESDELWWVENNGIDHLITNGSRKYATSNTVLDVAIHPMAIVVAWVEQRPGVQILMRNGAEVARGDVIKLAGVWSDGTCAYSVGLSGRFGVFAGGRELVVNASNITSLKMNITGTLLAWQETNFSANPRVRMYSDQMIEPWTSAPLDNVASDISVSPEGELIAFEARRMGRDLVFFNSAEYPAGERNGELQFSNDGSTMIYATENAGPYLCVNGKNYLIKSATPLKAQLAVNPAGTVVSWSTSASVLTTDVTMDITRTSRMFDKLTESVYVGSKNEFQALGVISNRIYLVRCVAY